MTYTKENMMRLFLDTLLREGLDAESVRDFYRYYQCNKLAWQRFEDIANEYSYTLKERISGVECMAQVRRRHRLSIETTAYPYFARMYNFKHHCKYFRTAKIFKFRWKQKPPASTAAPVQEKLFR